MLIFLHLSWSPVKLDLVQDDRCRASMDSLLNVGDYGPSLQSRGLLLNFAATAQSTMDYSTMAVDDGVADSPIALVAIPERSNSPSPTWPRNVLQAPLDRSKCTPAKLSLYDGVGDVHSGIPVKVCLPPCFLTVTFILCGPTLARPDLKCVRSGAFMFSSNRAKLIGGLGLFDVFFVLLALGFCNVVFCG